MICALVIGTISAQQKEASLAGKKLLLCERETDGRMTRFVAADLVGAGCGDRVLVSSSLIRVEKGNCTDWVDQWIVGIIDDMGVADRG